MSVTAEQAFEANAAGKPIMISAYHAVKLIASHASEPTACYDIARRDIAEFFTGRDDCKPVDLADVLEWLGY